MKILRKIALDMVPVLAGVLIALVINSWKENQSDKQFLDQVLGAIHKEVESSKADIKDVLPQHEALSDTIEVYLEDDSLSILELVQMTNGFSLSVIENAAWNALLNSNMQLVEYETFARLNAINEYKKSHEIHIHRLADYVMAKAMDTTADSKTVLYMHLRNVISSENQILELLDKHLEAAP